MGLISMGSVAVGVGSGLLGVVCGIAIGWLRQRKLQTVIPREVDEAQMRLAAIVESSEDAIIGKDQYGLVTSWNTAAERIFGYSADEMIGQSIKKLLPQDRLTEEDDILNKIRSGETISHIETLRKTKSGKTISVSLTISPIRDAQGRVTGASKICRDITEMRKLQYQLIQSQKMDALGQLTGGIAHDFNNLLAIVIGSLDLLEEKLADKEDALKWVHMAQKASERGVKLTQGLLTFSVGERLKPERLDLNHLIRNTLEMAQRALGPDIQIRLHLMENMPPAYADLAGVESALLNLIVNARDAMPQGGVLSVSTQVEVFANARGNAAASPLPPGRYAHVSISDTGTGMSPEVVQRAFEPFFTTKLPGKGTGLGLAMVYGFFKQSGGMVRIYSEVGFGTTMSLYLPLAETTADRIKAMAGEGRGTEEGGVPVVQDEENLPGTAADAIKAMAGDVRVKEAGSVLVVDDEEHLLDIALEYLKDMGYVAYRAADAPSALEMLRLHPEIGLLITDILMPGGMNGVELGRAAQERYPNLKVIYCSGYPANALSDRNLPLVDEPLLRKPFQQAAFQSVVHSVMHAPQNVSMRDSPAGNPTQLDEM